MSDFDYKISVVIPVYNCEKYLSTCIESLKKQTMPMDDFQIVFVNDGSKDKSGETCRRFSEEYSNIDYFEKENGGVSSARNKGLEISKGKYILFLDADDTISSNTLADMYAFFEQHYNEVDLVTYSIDYLDEEGNITTHKRFDVMTHSGIYDINSDSNVLQTTMNVCVKNVPQQERVCFDEELTLGEDQWFIFSWLLKKQKLGFVKEATYTYYRHSGSASSVFNNPYYCFDQYMSFLGKLIGAYTSPDGKPHKTAQALVVYNLGWRITSDMLVSHADKDTENSQYAQLREILSKVDNRIICNSIYIDPFHVECFMRIKGEKCDYAINDLGISFFNNDCLWMSQTHTIAIVRLKIVNNQLCVGGYIKNGVIDYKDITLYYEDKNTVLHEIEMYDSAFSYYKGKAKTNNFGGFDICIDLEDRNTFTFKMKIGDVIVTPVTYFSFWCCVNRQKYISENGGYRIEYNQKADSYCIDKVSAGKLAQARSFADKTVLKESKGAFGYRKISEKLYSKDRIWLYCDRENIFDNAYFQFLHDVEIKDGIKRYYIIDGLKDKSKYFTASQRSHIVEFKSFKHKILFLNCEKILTSFNSVSIFSPFGNLPLRWYSDIMKCQVVYLQHGVLHARLPLLYAKEKASVDKVVISSEFEKNNFKTIYNFGDNDLIASGMPRFDTIDIGKKAKRKILFSPSWRQNLIGEYIDNTRTLYVDKFLASPFYRQINEFLNSKELADLLEKYDLELDFKNHPIFGAYDKYFKVGNERVHVTQEKNEMQDYLMMITDYSSIVFDFVYLDRPILYFVPDYDQFKAGITHNYSVLDLPLEEGFGEISRTSEDLLKNLQYLAENDFVPQEKYKKRMTEFFTRRDTNHADRLYEALTK